MVSTRTRRQEFGPLPVILCGTGIEKDAVNHWDERNCAGGALGALQPEDLIRLMRSV